MGLTDDELQALRTRLLPSGAAAADVVADTVGESEELREILVDIHGDVVAFTDQRALFVAHEDADVVAVEYGQIEVRRRLTGLGIDALLEGGRLVLDVAKGTFVRLGVVGAGAPPGRASWLPERPPAPAPIPPPVPEPTATAAPAPVDITSPPLPPVSPIPPMSTFPPVPPLAPEPTRPSQPGPPSHSGPPSVATPSTGAPAPSAPAPAAAEPAWTVPSMPPPGLPPAGWNPDPSGRHWWRWWDGMSWTDHVADGGPSFVDPLPPR